MFYELTKEQLIRLDKHTGAHIYLTEYEIDEDGLYHITGNIDYVILQSDRKTAQEELYVALRNSGEIFIFAVYRVGSSVKGFNDKMILLFLSSIISHCQVKSGELFHSVSRKHTDSVALTMTSCYSQSKVSEFSVGNEKMQEGVISEPLYLGKEQLIRFDKHTK